MKTASYVVDTMSLRTTTVAATGIFYSLAKVGEVILKLPQAIALTLLMGYTIWIMFNVAMDSVVNSATRAYRT